MNSERDFQVVEVTGECCLRDGGGMEHRYWRRDGRPLPSGFYVVHWPAGTTPGRFNEEALFEGPFRSRGGAEAGVPLIRSCYRAEAAPEGFRRSPEDPITVVDDRTRRPFRRST